MNDLQMITSKICSAREILDCAKEAIQNSNYDKAETLIYAADEFLEYYIQEYDKSFEDAWQATVKSFPKEFSTGADEVVEKPVENLM